MKRTSIAVILIFTHLICLWGGYKTAKYLYETKAFTDEKKSVEMTKSPDPQIESSTIIESEIATKENETEANEKIKEENPEKEISSCPTQDESQVQEVTSDHDETIETQPYYPQLPEEVPVQTPSSEDDAYMGAQTPED